VTGLLIEMIKEKQAVTDALNLLANELGLEETTEACRKWLREHTGEIQAGDRFFTKGEVYRAFKKQRGLCAICGTVLIDPHVNRSVWPAERTVGDHFEPHSKGGKTVQSNCLAIHSRCNSEKGDLDPVQLAKRTGKTIAEVLRNQKGATVE